MLARDRPVAKRMEAMLCEPMVPGEAAGSEGGRVGETGAGAKLASVTELFGSSSGFSVIRALMTGCLERKLLLLDL